MPITARAASSALAHAVAGVSRCAARRARRNRSSASTREILTHDHHTRAPAQAHACARRSATRVRACRPAAATRRNVQAVARRQPDPDQREGTALVLAGGGARGAYEVGVLSALAP